MIVSDMSNWEQESASLAGPLRKALKWLESEITVDSPVGKYPIDGDLMYVLVQHLSTEPTVERMAEAHRQYIDIQLLLSGRESIRVARNNDLIEVTQDELEARDRLSYHIVDNESDIILTPGMFAIFFPNDIHRPCCSVEENINIRKAVVKLHVSLLA